MVKRLRGFGIVFILLALSFVALGSEWAHAQRYPNRPLQMIVPWAAGGGTDRVARMIALLLERELGQPVNVVNRTGGSGAIGHTAMAVARPDGYTLGMVTLEITMMHWLGLAQVKPSDLRAVALMNFDPAGITVRVDAPWNTVEELLDYIKAHPGELRASGTGRGGSWDVARAGLLDVLGLPETALPWVPSEGAAPALQDLVAGGVDVVTASLAEAATLIEAGRVKALAIMADERDALFPDVPTLKEKGIDWSMGVWRGIVVPRNTPDEVVRILEAALEKVYNSQEYQDFMRANGFGMAWRNADDFQVYMEQTDAQMGELMRKVGLAR